MFVLSNINKMAYFYAHVECTLLFVVLAGNSAWFQIVHSYTLLLKSCALLLHNIEQMFSRKSLIKTSYLNHH